MGDKLQVIGCDLFAALGQRMVMGQNRLRFFKKHWENPNGSGTWSTRFFSTSQGGWHPQLEQDVSTSYFCMSWNYCCINSKI